MPWFLNSLKVVGKGQAEISSLGTYDFDLASEEKVFLVVNKERDEVIKTLTFNQSTLDKELYGKKDIVHFFKVKEDILDHLRPEDFKLISDEYFKQTNQELVIFRKYK